jgi:hypothetical protein
MYYKSKYVVFEDERGLVIPMVFSELMQHVSMVPSNVKVLGAGFCYINEKGLYQCYGQSVGLGVQSREDDTRILNKYLGTIVDD